LNTNSNLYSDIKAERNYKTNTTVLSSSNLHAANRRGRADIRYTKGGRLFSAGANNNQLAESADVKQQYNTGLNFMPSKPIDTMSRKTMGSDIATVVQHVPSRPITAKTQQLRNSIKAATTNLRQVTNIYNLGANSMYVKNSHNYDLGSAISLNSRERQYKIKTRP